MCVLAGAHPPAPCLGCRAPEPVALVQLTSFKTRLGVPDETCTGRAPLGVAGAGNVVVVDNRNEVRDFLTSRRAKLTPDQAGLPAGSGNRRVAGLRRAEVAMLAGVSVEYYAKLERGSISGASDSVLHSIAGALKLDDAERAHLFDLARAANAPAAKPRQRRAKPGTIRPSLQRALDANVRRHGTGEKTFHHAVVGDLILAYEGLGLTTDPDLSFLIYTAEPGSPSEGRLRLLASWAASQEKETGSVAGADLKETDHSSS